MKLHRTKSGKSDSTLVTGADLVLDAALMDAGQDRLDHQAIATVVADMTMHAATPVNIAIFGAWGSGKSSFFGLLEQRIKHGGSKVRVARYDAWKYGGRALKKHFVASVAEQIGLGGKEFEDRLAHDQETLRLDLWDWVKRNKKSLAFGLLAAVIVTVLWFVLISAAALAVNHQGIGKAAQYALTTVGTALSLSFAALLVGPKILESAVVKVREAAPETDDEFAKSFETMVTRGVKVDAGERLVVFIDELDRCSPRDVVATLIDLKTFLDAKGCVFVVAADREVLERALREVPQANPVRSGDPYYSTPGAFLDKIFQHQIPLPPLRPQALTRFARQLVETQGGLWADLRAAQEEDRLFLRVVYGLIPIHVRSPRRVKVLLNNYATNVRIAQARGIDWLARAEEIATLTVIDTEFPSVVADLIRFPSLLTYLRGKSTTGLSSAAESTVASYLAFTEPPKTSSPEENGEGSVVPTPVAGELLIHENDDEGDSRRANKMLTENLLAYLRKIDASGFVDPRPDLLFLQSAGAQEGIDDPALADVIDLASEYSAADVVAAFTDQPSATVATAVRLLGQQADAERGPGRLAIIESVCRLTEHLDPVDAQAVGPLVAGSVLAEANNADWPTDATPGALILGVIGASKPLVRTLLSRQDAETMADAGTLGRIATVLNYASTDQSALVYELLGSAYYLHPEPLHDALRTTSPEVAHRLWDNALAPVQTALNTLGAPAAAVATKGATATAATRATPAPTPSDTAAERYTALLEAVTSRPDDSSEALISKVLAFGQAADLEGVRDAASDQAPEALGRIGDPLARNAHAMLGLRYSPLDEAQWWSGLLTEIKTDIPDIYVVFERLLGSLATSSDDETENITIAIPKVIPYLGKDELSDAQRWVGVTLSKIAWSTESAATAKNRAAVYRMAEALRPRLDVSDAAELDVGLATDIVNGLATNVSDNAHVKELLDLTKAATSEVAGEIEKQALERTTTTSDAVLTLRLRIAAASRGSNAAISADDVLAVDDMEGDREVFAEWLALCPPLAESQKVFGKITIHTIALGKYAEALDINERTTLWVDLASRTGSWGPTAFSAVGKHGLNSAAVEHISKAVAAATQQGQRDALIDRLATASLVEQPQHRAATDLILQLLGTGVAGDMALAARVAIQSGGAAYGKTVTVRNAFNAAVAERPKGIKKGHLEQLQELGLLRKPSKKGVKGFVEGLIGG